MRSPFSRATVAGLSLAGAMLIGTVPVFPQAPTPAARPQGAAAPAAPGPQAPGQPGGRSGRGGLGGPQENDPANATADYGPKPPVKPLTPSEEQKRFWLPPGFKMEPVLTDPDIEESAQIAFDGNGRMFVLELRGYMQDADATGELDPVGRISVHEDRDNDGKYAKHSIFVDKLIFPRFVMPYGANAVLTMESNAEATAVRGDRSEVEVISTIQRSNDPTIQRSNDPTIQRSNDPTVQRSKGNRSSELSEARLNELLVNAFNPDGSSCSPWNVGSLDRWELTEEQR